ncbi:Fumarate reductase flavoprotein subunit [Saezia sanguinis]|uniref:Fumarate reductase flavoprotein subunit n=1 Tax=Saezia sanguinis TaxID=1965230 RepID=A0A433SCB5_9BURK|nr:fumarate reductase (quinol) flavoprotein subunit [Saezia sanguinis]RUS66381.1 Fumarate reductase flavoprotein subunit [Saezia sanguinis]
MQTYNADVAIVGAGGGGLRAAIEIARTLPDLKVALISKVYPMRSHTVAAEGGAAAVVRDDDSLEYHFNDTVSGGDWLCEQDVVDYFVQNSATEMVQLEHWGCPWSRQPDGHVNVRRFGGMKIPRTWFAADKSGFHILHTLFQTSMQFPSIHRFDEHFVMDLMVEDGKVNGVLCFDMKNGEPRLISAPAVVLATGGAGRCYRFNTNGGIVTGDGMAIAYRHGVPLRDMEFVQYHPTGLLGSGILMTEGCRGEGGILVNKDGYRYLQDYGMGPETPVGQPKNKYMELGPRDKVSQAFWHEQKKGRVIETPLGDAVYLDMRHLGEKHLHERLPLICELAEQFAGVDPVKDPVPVRPVVHYTMGGIETDGVTATRMPGLFAVGECASVGLHGANRLGSNSLAEIVVFGKVAGEQAAKYAQAHAGVDAQQLLSQAQKRFGEFTSLLDGKGTENPAAIRDEMGDTMEEGVGIYRDAQGIQKTIDKLAELKERYRHVRVNDKSQVFNTDWLSTIELGYTLDVAQTMAYSALNRKESRGSHQRLDATERDDVNFLQHTLAFYQQGTVPKIDYSPVKITKSQPAKRVYGAEGEETK